jgi:hypothetical protein
VGAPLPLCDGPVRAGAGQPGAGAPNVLCANRCSGAGSASATAVPHSPATRAVVIAETRTGVFLACGRLSVCFAARVRRGLVASMNASMAAASPDSSRSVPGWAAASRTSVKACWEREASGHGSRPARSRSAIASSSDRPGAPGQRKRRNCSILARRPLDAGITLQLLVQMPRS